MKRLISITLITLLTISISNGQELLKKFFIGPATGDSIFYNIYLPKGYKTSTIKYPVVYHLHGINGSQGGKQNITVPKDFEEAYDLGKISKRHIIVFPNGLTNSMWADSKSGIIEVSLALPN